jgi:predicted AAA+ superfamily ATPase
MKRYTRNITDPILDALKSNPAILVLGARQAGKTTLMKEIGEHNGFSYTTFDDLFSQGAADADPVGFLESLDKPTILDEIQRAPKIFLPMKKDIDENRIAGRYILTGSANPLVVPQIGDSLAGRMQIIHIWPLSQGELRGIRESFIDAIFLKAPLQIASTRMKKDELVKLAITGGYPSLQKINNEKMQYDWCNSYLTSIVQKDITDLAKIENLRSIPNILQILATRVGNILIERDIARNVAIPPTSLHRYLQLLQHLFLIFFLPPWHRNLGKRIIKSPKTYFVDTAILMHLLSFNAERLSTDLNMQGRVIENFVIAEILKQITWNRTIVKPYHYRTHDGSEEVDLVLESTSGKIVGIEIKNKETISMDDFKGLKMLQENSGKDFHRGILLHAGNKQHSFGKDLIAIPMSSIWTFN